MRTRAFLLLTAMVALMGASAVSPASAQENSARRVRAFAATPNWAGLWETEIAAASAASQIDREAEQLLHAARPAPGAAKAALHGQRTLQQGSGVAALPPTGPTAPGVAEIAFIRHVKLLGAPPYNREWERKYRLEMENGTHPTGPPFSGTCATTFPAIMENPVEEGMFEALVTPEEVLLVFGMGQVRHIYTDGRSHPRKEDLWPTDMGDSIGRWEGQTLVVDTIARKPGRVVPELPIPMVDLSDQAHFVERLHLVDYDTMQNDMTIEDPARFVHAWHLRIRYKRVKGLDRMIMGSCTENNRNAVVNGKMIILPP